MGCQRCGLPAGGAPLHKKCAENARDYYHAYWSFTRPTLGVGALNNAIRAEKQWKAYLGWENAKFTLLGRDADTHTPRSRCKPYDSIREFNLAVQEIARRRIELGPYPGEDPCFGREEPC